MELIPADDTIKSEVVIPAKTEHKFIGTLTPHPGHTCYQFNLITKKITLAVFETTTSNLSGKNGRKLIVQPDCIYCTALNPKNAIKRFFKMLQLNAAIQMIKPKTDEKDLNLSKTETQ
jgi:hypothetical protein